MEGYKGTKRGYMPPEVLSLRKFAINKNNNNKNNFDGIKADIFSLGVLLFSMVFNNLPFKRACETDS